MKVLAWMYVCTCAREHIIACLPSHALQFVHFPCGPIFSDGPLQAIEALQRVLEIAEQTGDVSSKAAAYSNIGIAMQAQGQVPFFFIPVGRVYQHTRLPALLVLHSMLNYRTALMTDVSVLADPHTCVPNLEIGNSTQKRKTCTPRRTCFLQLITT